MALPRFEEDVQIISKIPNYPGSEGGLTPEQFRAKFDEAAQLIKDYLNMTLLPEMDATVDVQALLNNILDTTLSKADKAAQAKAVGEALAKLLPKAGGTMTGALSVLAPTADSHAAPKVYVDDLVEGTYGNWTVSIPASGWTGDGPYSQTISVPGVMASDRPHICLVPADDVIIAETQEAAWSCVSRAVSGDGFITFTCYEDWPEVSLTVQIEVNR